MSKKITRTIETHTIYGAEVDMEDGVLKSFDLGKIAMTGCKPTKENAMKELRKRYGRNKNYVVKEIVTDCNEFRRLFSKRCYHRQRGSRRNCF